MNWCVAIDNNGKFSVYQMMHVECGVGRNPGIKCDGICGNLGFTDTSNVYIG